MSKPGDINPGSTGAPVTPTTPVPIPTGADAPRFILVFGGTFDPPHKGHIDLPVRVRDELDRRSGALGAAGSGGGAGGWLLYVPAARSPLKQDNPIASDADRRHMLELALAEAGTVRASIWTDELDRAAAALNAGQPQPPSYTVDTLGRLRSWIDERGLGGTQLRLLIGADQAASFHRWRQPRDVLRLAQPVVMVRGGIETEKELTGEIRETGFWTVREIASWAGWVVPVGRLDVAATQIRQALIAGNPGAIDALIPHAVAMFIRERRLYSPH